MDMKQTINQVPILGPVIARIYRKINHLKPFQGSARYWEDRYNAGGNSGNGSYNQFAKFKAVTLNKFVFDNRIKSVIEYGCGDGNQLSLAQYPKYIGFDVSQKAISICLKFYANDETKTFKIVDAYDGEKSDLSLSLDVIYHLIEDNVYENYMNRLFDSADKFVVIYSSDTDENPKDTAVHVKHRKFTKWVTHNRQDWILTEHIPNKYPFNEDNKRGSFADFYIFKKT